MNDASVDKNRGAEFMSRIREIKEFELIVAIPPISYIEDDDFARSLMDLLYEEVSQAVTAADFFYTTEIEPRKDSQGISVVYGDDKFDFSVKLERSCIRVTRTGSKMTTFKDWYERLMPLVGGVIDSITAALSEKLKRKIIATNVSYCFKLIAYGFQQDGCKRRNFEILSPLVTSVPGADGTPSPASSEYSQLARVDFNVHRWFQCRSGKRRSVIYRVEAPANKDFTSVWFTLAYRGATFTDPITGVREQCNAEELLEEYEEALTWFEGSAIGSFIYKLLNGLDFDTTSSVIP